MKRRSLTLVLCLLATLSLASVGFAAWVISAGDTENLTGNITVHAVSDQRLTIEELTIDGAEYNVANSSWKNTVPEFIFGKGTGEEKWLKNDTVDKLTLKVKFKIYENTKDSANPSGTKEEVTDTDKITITNTFAANIAAAGKDSEDVDMTYADIVNAAPEATYNDASGYWEFDIALKWGNFFGKIGDFAGVVGTNPFTYYNGLEFSDTNANDAFTKLDAMYQAVKAATYSLTIKVDYQTQQQ